MVTWPMKSGAEKRSQSSSVTRKTVGIVDGRPGSSKGVSRTPGTLKLKYSFHVGSSVAFLTRLRRLRDPHASDANGSDVGTAKRRASTPTRFLAEVSATRNLGSTRGV